MSLKDYCSVKGLNSLLEHAMASINPVLRKQVYYLAQQEEPFTYGEEQKFWKCVSEAALQHCFYIIGWLYGFASKLDSAI
ncbi:hypothetical protein [Vibrio brasiliensis]